jgi:hypothetical protein
VGLAAAASARAGKHTQQWTQPALSTGARGASEGVGGGARGGRGVRTQSSHGEGVLRERCRGGGGGSTGRHGRGARRGRSHQLRIADWSAGGQARCQPLEVSAAHTQPAGGISLSGVDRQAQGHHNSNGTQPKPHNVRHLLDLCSAHIQLAAARLHLNIRTRPQLLRYAGPVRRHCVVLNPRWASPDCSTRSRY